MPDGDENNELGGAQLRQAERAAAARPGAAVRIGNVNERICASHNLRMPDFTPKRVPPPPSLQRAGMTRNV